MIKDWFKRSQKDVCLHLIISHIVKLYVLLYVNDLLTLGTNLEEVQRLKRTSNEFFFMKYVDIVTR